jgi:alkanesulfonate monooxygenase SsuD/methylene tetrahydromethanopterin reductase-like flavin-dependent oxidoreductase (luciferase family)
MLATSLAEASSDRFVLGLGAGSPPLAEGLHDVEFTEPVQRLAAVTRQVRGLLNGQRLDVTAERYNRPLKLAVTPQREIPIHLAALGRSPCGWRVNSLTAGHRSFCRSPGST